MGRALLSHLFRLLCAFVTAALCFATPAFAAMAGPKEQSQIQSPRSGMLIPLYVYPSPGAWEPLYFA